MPIRAPSHCPSGPPSTLPLSVSMDLTPLGASCERNPSTCPCVPLPPGALFPGLTAVPWPPVWDSGHGQPRPSFVPLRPRLGAGPPRGPRECCCWESWWPRIRHSPVQFPGLAGTHWRREASGTGPPSTRRGSQLQGRWAPGPPGHQTSRRSPARVGRAETSQCQAAGCRLRGGHAVGAGPSPWTFGSWRRGARARVLPREPERRQPTALPVCVHRAAAAGPAPGPQRCPTGGLSQARALQEPQGRWCGAPGRTGPSERPLFSLKTFSHARNPLQQGQASHPRPWLRGDGAGWGQRVSGGVSGPGFIWVRPHPDTPLPHLPLLRSPSKGGPGGGGGGQVLQGWRGLGTAERGVCAGGREGEASGATGALGAGLRRVRETEGWAGDSGPRGGVQWLAGGVGDAAEGAAERAREAGPREPLAGPRAPRLLASEPPASMRGHARVCAPFSQ